MSSGGGWDWPAADSYSSPGPDLPFRRRTAVERAEEEAAAAEPIAMPPEIVGNLTPPGPPTPAATEAAPLVASSPPDPAARSAEATLAPDGLPLSLEPPPTAADLPIGLGEEEIVAKTGGRIVRNTAIFSIATGLSRIAGLVREVVASSYFGTTGPASAFTLAFQVPNLLRSLVADSALSAAFVPVFTELLEQKRRKDAFQLATTLLFYIVAGLGLITAFFIFAAPVIMPIFIGPEFTPYLTDLTIGLSQVLFPIVLFLGINGLVVGILNAYDHFAIPAIAPLVWNIIIIVGLILLRPQFHAREQIYAYAIAVVIATFVQLAISVPMLRRVGFRFSRRITLRDARVGKVFVLMLPVTIGLGVINFDMLINSGLGTLVSRSAPSAIDRAFRVYMLPQGMFSVALATVLFPALSRFAARKDLDGMRTMLATGTRQIFFLLIPAAVFTLVLAEPIVQLIYQRGQFGPKSTQEVSTALFWFSFSLPFAGVNLLLTRTFFSLQRPWYPTVLAMLSMVVNIVISLLLYKPLGIAGLVIGTAASSAVMCGQQFIGLRRLLGGRLDAGHTLTAVIRISIASVLLGVIAYGTWYGLHSALGESLAAQVISVGMASMTGLIAYLAAARLLRIHEMEQIENAVRNRRAGRTA